MFEVRLVTPARETIEKYSSLMEAFGFATLQLCEYGEMKPSEAKGILDPVMLIACNQIIEAGSEMGVWEVEDKDGIVACFIKNLDGGGLPDIVVSPSTNDIE